MNQKLNKLIKDVAEIDVEAARYIELEAPKLKSYKIFDNISLYNLFNWPDAPQPPGYWSDIDEKVFMRAKGHHAGKKLTLLRFKDHTGLEHDFKFTDAQEKWIIDFIDGVGLVNKQPPRRGTNENL